MNDCHIAFILQSSAPRSAVSARFLFTRPLSSTWDSRRRTPSSVGGLRQTRTTRHCHFFSEQFFATLGRQRPPGSQQSAADIVAALGWDRPGSPEDLADRWVKELDRAGVARAALIASVPGDEESVARAVARHPSRIRRLLHARSDGSRCGGAHRARARPARPARHLSVSGDAALFAARSAREGDRAARRGARRHGCLRALRRALGRRAQEARTAEPLRRAPRQSPRSSRACRRPSRRAVHHSALRRGAVPRSVARRRPLPQTCTSTRRARTGGCRITMGSRCPASSGRRSRLPAPDRLLFGTDSSFFPRGWNRAVYDAQVSALDAAGVDESVRHRIFTGNFDRLFPA